MVILRPFIVAGGRGRAQKNQGLSGKLKRYGSCIWVTVTLSVLKSERGMIRAWQITLLGVVLLFAGSLWAADAVTSLSLDLPKPERQWFGEWWLGTAIQNFSEGKDEGTGSGFRGGVLIRYQLAPWARFQFDSEVRAYASRVQARYDDDIMNSGIKVREGFFALGSDQGFEFRSGVLNQADVNSDLLISRKRAFPGIREGYTMGSRDMRLSLWAQQTIPTSYSLNTRREDREPMPSFLSETVGFKITPVSQVEAEVVATHFRFNNLPAVVAFESSALGNTVQGEVAPNNEFKYGFEGFAVGSQVCLCLTGRMQFRFGGQWLQNTQAPESANRGQLLFLETTLRLPNEVEIRPRFSTYFNESDTSPAYYNNWTLGNNNRKGFIAALDVEFKKYGFVMGAEYVQATMINSDPFQNDKQVLTISVETNHVPF